MGYIELAFNGPPTTPVEWVADYAGLAIFALIVLFLAAFLAAKIFWPYWRYYLHGPSDTEHSPSDTKQ